MNAILGKKQDQSQVFLIDGTRMPATKISVAGTVVVAVKSMDKNGYTAIQLGIGQQKRATKALLGHVAKAGLVRAPAFFREVRLSDEGELPTPGTSVKASDVLKAGNIVQVTGVSKGKGFAGGVKRYRFKGGPRTHGQSDRERAPGSIGQATTPGRVYKGKRMAGRMGHDQVTVKNLTILDINGDEVYVKGLVPGGRNSIVLITKTGEDKKFVPVYKEEKKETEEKKMEAEAKDAESNETKETKDAEGKEEVKEEEVSEAITEEVKENKDGEK